MKILNICIFVFVTMFSSMMEAQQAYKGQIGHETGLFIISAAGLPARVVKTTIEITASKNEYGMLLRHSELAGNQGNPNVNAKVSPKFAISPKNVNKAGEHQDNAQILWHEACGWTSGINNVNATHPVALPLTGCAAYKGPDGTDQTGTWRMPTQRELNLLILLKNELNSLPGFTPLGPPYPASYWAATEKDAANIWFIELNINVSRYCPRHFTGPVRCLKDL